MVILNCLSLIILIIFEIVLTIFVVLKLQKARNSVKELNEQLKILGEAVLISFVKVKNIVIKTNRVVAFVTNEKFVRVHSIIKIFITSLQIFIFIKTLDFSKGIKNLNFKNIKKILFSQIAKKLALKAVNYFVG